MTDIFSAVSTRPPACLSTPALVFSSDLAKPNQVWWIFGTRGKSAILFSKSFRLPGQLRRFSLYLIGVILYMYRIHVQCIQAEQFEFNSVQYGVPFLYLLLIILSYLVLDPFFLIKFFFYFIFLPFPALNRVF